VSSQLQCLDSLSAPEGIGLAHSLIVSHTRVCYNSYMATKRGSAGGTARAITQRQAAFSSYYANPRRCLNCSAVIAIRAHSSAAETRRKNFCNHKCAAAYNNRVRLGKPQPTLGFCGLCGRLVDYKKTTNGAYFPRKYCDNCAQIARNNSKGLNTPALITKGRLFATAKHWQSARSMIQKLARDAYCRSGKPLVCSVCCYDKHIEVCHVKSVRQFPGDTLLTAINSPDNLVALCPNHHWELDHGLLHLPAINEKTALSGGGELQIRN